MPDLITAFLTVPAVLMVALICLPNRWANSFASLLGRVVTCIVAGQFFVTAGLLIAFAAGMVPVAHKVLGLIAIDSPIAITLHYDGVSGLMLTLVSFVGWVICKFSIRYLDGEATQGRYFRWTSFTIGSVSVMVLSGNLLMFIVAWVMTSVGLHQLLLHYGHRPVARRAAWTKFLISRLGDVALMAAMAILYLQFRTLDFVQLFELAGQDVEHSLAVQLSGFLLVLGAVTKSAQVPFHTWLPQTMETPTPVSALMHAGIVNAGGYLMIRTSPLVSISPWAMASLAVIGGTTACFAAVVMLTQTSVKKSLAYSTIAQMGFMLLQCGVGAYSAAMVHILAHSLYKAYAFLSSGSVIAERAKVRGSQMASVSVHWTQFVSAALISVALLSAAFAVFGVNPSTKPGGWMLGGVLCLAMTHWIGQSFRGGIQRVWLRTIAVSAALCVTYVATFVAVDAVIANSLTGVVTRTTAWPVTMLVALGFGGLFLIQFALESGRGLALLNKWHIHAVNGFYLESIIRRVITKPQSN